MEASKERQCPNCGVGVKSDQNFCTECGIDLKEPERDRTSLDGRTSLASPSVEKSAEHKLHYEYHELTPEEKAEQQHEERIRQARAREPGTGQPSTEYEYPTPIAIIAIAWVLVVVSFFPISPV